MEAPYAGSRIGLEINLLMSHIAVHMLRYMLQSVVH
jgi:hypothetical protein